METNNTVFRGDLREAKALVKKFGRSAKSPSMTETIRQVFWQLQREKERLGLKDISFSDITLSPRQ